MHCKLYIYIGVSKLMATSLQPVKSWKKNPVEVVKGWILLGWAQISSTLSLSMFCGSSFDYQKNFVCDEVGLITDITILHVVGRKVGLMTYESIIILLALWIGSYGPNSWRLYNTLNLQVIYQPSPIKLHFVVYLV